MSKSVYGSGGASGRLIYGGRPAIPCCVTDLCLTRDLLGAFNTLINQVEVIVSDLYQASEIKSSLITNMEAKAFVSYPMMVRIIWRRQHPTDEWIGSDEQILQLLDIYLMYGWDWKGDKLFDQNAGCLPEDLLPAPDVPETMVTQAK